MQQEIENRSNLVQQIGRKSTDGWLIPIILFYLINPPLCLIGVIFIIVKNNVNSEKIYYTFYLLLALYLGLIMSTKVPVSDWETYKEQFELAGKLNFLEYIVFFEKEPVFYIISYVIYKLFDASFVMFSIIIISGGYFLAFIAIHKFWKHFFNHSFVILFAVLIFAFFNNYFSYAGHLTRQVLACNIFIFFAVHKLIYKKNLWVLIIMAVLIHSSSFVLFLACFIPKLRQKINLKNLLVLSLSLIVFISISGFLIQYLLKVSDIGWLNYGLQAAEGIEGFSETWYTGKSTTVSRIYYFAIMAIMGLSYFIKNKKSDIYFLFNLYIVLICLIEYFVFSNLLFLQLRFMVFIYAFIPFFVPLLFIKNDYFRYKYSTTTLFFIILVLGSVFRFYIGLSTSNFQYSPIVDLLIFPPIMYFF